VSNGWQVRYAELKEYIAGKPKINISSNIIAIPGDLRPEFYRLFDTVRVAFLRESFPVQLNEAEALSKNFTKTEEEVTKLPGLADISLSASLNWFLREPTNGLMRGLFDSLFDLLKKKIDVDIFELAASRNIEKSFTNLYHSGYERWVVLSLVKLLALDKIFEVPIAEVEEDGAQAEADTTPGAHEDVVSKPVETKSLSLIPGAMVPFVVPDFIVHSASVNRYVSLRSGMLSATWRARVVSDNREWYDRSSLTRDYGEAVKWPALMVYASDELGDLALVADHKRVCRPDIIIECMEQKDWYQAGELERVRLNHAMLKPKMGTYVVSLESAPEAVSAEPEEQESGIHILTVGYDQSQLAPIIDALLPGKEAALS